METKIKYIKPDIELIKIEIENVIAGSPLIGEDEHTGAAGAPKRKFWNEGNE